MRATPLLAALALVAGAACATKGDVTSLQSSLDARLDTVRARQDSLRDEVRELRQTLLRREKESASLTRTRTAELERRIAGLREQVAQLTQLTGQTQRTLRRRLEAISERLDVRPAGSGGGSDSAAAPVDTADGGEAAASDTVGGGDVPATDDPEELYETGVQQFRRGAYETARIALDELLSAYPRHELAPDAQFFLARTYQDAGQDRRALEELQRVLELYPNSDRASAALFQRGRIHRDLGNTDEARSAFEQVLRGYPDSPEAELAEEQLSEVGGAAADTTAGGGRR